MSRKFNKVKLGKKAPVHDPRTLKLSSYLTKLPPTPAKHSWLALPETLPDFKWNMFRNDKIGCCAIAGPAHIHAIWSINSEQPDVYPTVEDVVRDYSRVGGYVEDRPETDNGCIMLNVMNTWRHDGLFNLRKLHAYVSLNPNKLEHVKAGIYMFGALNIGLSLPASAQSQDDLWSVTDPKLRGNAAKYSWGGHCVIISEYDSVAKEFVCITWGRRQRMTFDFFQTYCDEAYVGVSEDWLNLSGISPSGLDLKSLKEDMLQAVR